MIMSELQWYAYKKDKYERILKELRKEVKQNGQRTDDERVDCHFWF